MPTLDFVIIGAPKAGTTSLFEYLRTHPEVHLPKWKETNFFLDPIYQRGVKWYFDWVLADAPADAVCGEASVRYMAGTPHSEESAGGRTGSSAEGGNEDAFEGVLPARISAALPEAKLIAILRDPVERGASEHGMASLRGEEQRSLSEAMRDSLEPARLERARSSFSPATCYVAGGEYGRILEPFYRLYSEDQLLVLFTSELADEPGAVVQRVCRFLGVSEDFTPPNLGVRYLKGATETRVRMLDVPRLAKSLKRRPAVRRAWRRLPAGLRQRVWTSSYAVEKWNRVVKEGKDTKDSGIDADLEAALRAHFRPDRERLAALTGLEPPWA